MLPVQSPSSCVLQFAHPSISHAPSRAFSLPPRFAAGPVIVGSAGSKGSGKSTLLNKLFDTDFGVGRSLGPAARPQGGVALCAAGDGVLMCVDYDAVGTGAEEATTNGKILALTTRLADVIVLNLWSSDVGRNVPYNTLALQVKGGGEMGKVESIRDTPISCVFFSSLCHSLARPYFSLSPLLCIVLIGHSPLFLFSLLHSLPQAIFQEQLQAEGSPKTLLLVAVHDHAGHQQDERTREAILQDLDSIWAGVPKSEDKAYAELSELFDMEIAFLPHPRYRPEEYER